MSISKKTPEFDLEESVENIFGLNIQNWNLNFNWIELNDINKCIECHIWAIQSIELKSRNDHKQNKIYIYINLRKWMPSKSCTWIDGIL